MDRLPYNEASDTNSKSAGQKTSGGLLSFFKKIGRSLRSSKRASAAAHLKKEINHLEKERAREQAALLQQRKFYERLIRKRTTPPAAIKKPAQEDKPISPLIEEKISTKVEPITPMPIVTESDNEKIKPVEEPILAPAVEMPVIERVTMDEPKPTEEKVEAAEALLQNEKETITEEVVPTTVDITPPDNKPKASAFQSFFARLRSKVSHGNLAGKLAAEREAEEAVKNKNDVEERAWQPYNGVKANLIKDQGVLFFNWQQRMLILALALVLCCLAISLVYVGLLIWQKERLNDNQSTLANFEAINTEISKNEKDIQEIIDFNRKLDIVSYILANHVYWTNFFGFLENNTLKDVYYESFTGDLSGGYTIPAIAKNLDSVSLQLEVMKAYTAVRSVQYSGAQTIPAGPTRPETTKFNLEVTIDPKLFTK